MSDFASGTSGGRAEQQRGLRPFKPGDVGNPKGNNQYSYKRAFELTIDALLKGELSPEEVETLPDWVRELVSVGMTRGEAIAAVTVAGALRGDSKHLAAVLKRIWPEVMKHEMTPHEDTPPAANPLEHLEPAEQAEWLRLTQRAAVRAAQAQLGSGAELPGDADVELE